jgi:peptidyl-prolyl cis-trans isomerase C
MLGQLRPGDVVPEVEAALDALSPGEIGPEPVASRFGWHVLRLDAAEDGRPLPYESVRPRLAAAMEKAAWARAARAFVDGLVAAADLQGVDLGRARAAGGLR